MSFSTLYRNLLESKRFLPEHVHFAGLESINVDTDDTSRLRKVLVTRYDLPQKVEETWRTDVGANVRWYLRAGVTTQEYVDFIKRPSSFISLVVYQDTLSSSNATTAGADIDRLEKLRSVSAALEEDEFKELDFDDFVPLSSWVQVAYSSMDAGMLMRAYKQLVKHPKPIDVGAGWVNLMTNPHSSAELRSWACVRLRDFCDPSMIIMMWQKQTPDFSTIPQAFFQWCKNRYAVELFKMFGWQLYDATKRTPAEHLLMWKRSRSGIGNDLVEVGLTKPGIDFSQFTPELSRELANPTAAAEVSAYIESELGDDAAAWKLSTKLVDTQYESTYEQMVSAVKASLKQ